MDDITALKIIVWMNQPSHYQTVFFRELASRPEVELRVVYATALPNGRKALGWTEPAEERYPQTVVVSALQAIKYAWVRRRATHLVNGVWSVPIFSLISLGLVLSGASVYFHSERPNSAKARGRFWHYFKRLWVSGLFLGAKGIFVIGRRAGDYYQALGVPAEKIIPFMYFNRGCRPHPRSKSIHPFTVIYVGQFIDRKRVEDLIDAFAVLSSKHRNARLKLVGAGPLRDMYHKKAVSLKLSVQTSALDQREREFAAEGKAQVEIIGPLAPDFVHEQLTGSDVLVLPSVFDGWGLTVNEALQAGVPAVCSNSCGVAELLEDNPLWGVVYQAGDVAALAAALERIASNPQQYRLDPNAIEEKIGPKSLTNKFLDAIKAQAKQ